MKTLTTVLAGAMLAAIAASATAASPEPVALGSRREIFADGVLLHARRDQLLGSPRAGTMRYSFELFGVAR